MTRNGSFGPGLNVARVSITMKVSEKRTEFFISEKKIINSKKKKRNDEDYTRKNYKKKITRKK